MAVAFVGSCCLPRLVVPVLAQDGVLERMKKPLSAPRNEVALAAVGGKVYVVGGSVGGDAVPLIDEYDPPSDGVARDARPMPKGLDHLGVAVIGGKIITVGGFIGSVHRGAVSDVYEYDPAANTWRALAPMKNPRGSVGVAVLDGKVHAIGGRGVDNTFTVGTHEVFDPATGQWSERAPLPQAARSYGAGGARRQAACHRRPLTNPASGATHTRSEDRRGRRADIYDPAEANSWSCRRRRCRPRASGLASCELIRGHDRRARRRACRPTRFAEQRGLRSEVERAGGRLRRCRTAATAPARP